ncbi:MAG: KH domain-containing protein [Ignavibacteriales bacterium]|nr:KH domain-containing protein [Ignavibacteriales bacterium]
MREFIEYIAKQLVDTPSAVVVTEEEKEGKVVFKLKVGESDVGKIIGRKGRSAQAMRVLLSAVAAKNGKRAILEVVD